MEVLRAAVVGLGNMGRHHARILSAVPGVSLVAVVDPDTSRAKALALPEDTAVLESVSDLPELDVAVVAVPTDAHAGVAVELIGRGVSLLVEKPLAHSPEEAREIVDASRTAGLTLAVGHVERFNPAVGTLQRLLERPLFLQFERMSPYTPRIRDSVVFDLMVHDLDLACWMVGEYPSKVDASGVAVFSDSLDAAAAVLQFPSGGVATLSSSRMTQDKVRRIAVSEPERYLVADSIRQDVSIKRETTVEFDDSKGSLYRQANVVEVPYLDRRGEPLLAELTDFVDAVREGRQPLVSGEAGAAAVSLAYEVERAASAS